MKRLLIIPLLVAGSLAAVSPSGALARTANMDVAGSCVDGAGGDTWTNSQFDGCQVQSPPTDTTATSTDRFASGTRSLKSTGAAARTWWNVNWTDGTQVTYGAKIYIASGLPSSCRINPIRWDNYNTFGDNGDATPDRGDRGGLTISGGNISVTRDYFGAPSETTLVSGGAFPLGSWVNVQVKQTFSRFAGTAKTQLYVNGVLKGTSTAANSDGRKIDTLYFGNVDASSACATTYLDDAVATVDVAGATERFNPIETASSCVDGAGGDTWSEAASSGKFDGCQVKTPPTDSIGRSTTRAFAGAGSLLSTGPAARAWWDVGWRNGADIAYGAALYITTLPSGCYLNPIRWDNYNTYGGVDDSTPGRGDLGGLSIENGSLRVLQDYYGSTGEQVLVNAGAVPLNQWFTVDVYQHLSAVSGTATTNILVNGVSKGTSTAPNSEGRTVDTIRYGNVNATSNCTGQLYTDNPYARLYKQGP